MANRCAKNGNSDRLFSWASKSLKMVNAAMKLKDACSLEEKLWPTSVQFSSVQSLSRVRLFATPWITAHQASLSITNSRSSLRFMSIESVMPSSHLILCRPLLLLPPTPPSIRVFSSESTLHMRWPKYWSFSFSISPSKEYPGLISFRMDWLGILKYSVQFSCSVVSDSLQPHESQHTRHPCLSPNPRVHPNSCPSSQWCHPATSSSDRKYILLLITSIS